MLFTDEEDHTGRETKEGEDAVVGETGRNEANGILVMAGCDVHAKFRSVTAKNTGSTNDNVAWDASALADALSKGNLPSHYFIGRDEAFSCSEYLRRSRSQGDWMTRAGE